MLRGHHCQIAMLAVCGTIVASTSAFGNPSEADEIRAKENFDIAKQLVKEKKYAEACPKYAESYRLDPRTGTQLNLADCYEHVDQFASAWIHFEDAKGKDTRDGDTKRAEFARKRSERIESKVPKLVIDAPPAVSSLEGLVVEIDDKRIEKTEWSGAGPTPIPIDPGKHVITVNATGRKTWTREIDIRVSERKTLTLEPLEEIPKPPLVPVEAANTIEPAQKPASANTVVSIPAGHRSLFVEKRHSVVGRKIAGGVFGVLGVGGIVTGSVFGLSARSKWENALDLCITRDPNDCKNKVAAEPVRIEAKAAAQTSTAFFVVGTAAIAGSALLLFWPTKEQQKPRAFLIPHFNANTVGATLIGTF